MSTSLKFHYINLYIYYLCVYVCMCVCVRENERERAYTCVFLFKVKIIKIVTKINFICCTNFNTGVKQFDLGSQCIICAGYSCVSVCTSNFHPVKAIH